MFLTKLATTSYFVNLQRKGGKTGVSKDTIEGFPKENGCRNLKCSGAPIFIQQK